MYLIDSSFIKEDMVLIDCRYDMSQPEVGPKLYGEGHLKGAYYIDLDKDMTGPLSDHGGRHPLADLEIFTQKICSFGITNETTVVIYDNGELPMATRLWFMLRLIGLEKVYVLRGGYQNAVDAGYQITKEIPQTVESQLEMSYQKEWIVSMDTVKEATENPSVAIVDSRSNERYLGLEEPFDKIAGRIPSAINYFWKDNFDGSSENGDVKDYGKIEAMFLEMQNYNDIIVHCGSGITGCVNVFLLNEIGIKTKLYLGSYSDWISYDNNEIIIKDNKRRIVKN